MACGGAELAQCAEHRGPVERFDVRCCGIVRADWAQDAQGFSEEAVGETERGQVEEVVLLVVGGGD